MKGTVLFPDGFRTDQILRRLTAPIGLDRRSFSKSDSHVPTLACLVRSQVAFCPMLVRWPSGPDYFKFQPKTEER